ncbi:hypothetical protein DFP73DRAFT_524141 [Morchella snyderi]|nr:hypothetical protein DFP73DRAFT_524141 [Morchella snyderi]
MGRTDPFRKLNIYELAIIAELLPPIDIIRLRRVSRTWNNILSSEYICKVALQAHFPRSKETKRLHEMNASTIVPARPGSKIIKEEDIKEEEDEAEEPPKKIARGKGKSKMKRRPSMSHELRSISGSPKKVAANRGLSEVCLSFSRATFRLHARAIAKPTKVHKYRLHHICDRGFTSTAGYLFWCESNRKIWQQKIGEGISGRRGLKLGSVGNRIAHVHQITAVENVPGRNGSGLVVLLFREVLTWGLEMAALDYETDEVVWKVSLADNPNSLQRTRGWVHYLTQTQMPAVPGPNGAITQEYRYMLVVHCILTGKMLSRTVLSDSWPTQKRPGYPNFLPEPPGAYTVFPTSNLRKGKPEKMVVAFEDRGSKIPGEEVPKKAAYKVLVYSLANDSGEDATLLKDIELERSGIGIGTNLLEKSIRMEFSSDPSPQKGYPNLLLIESTSHPHVIPPKTRNANEKLEYPTLSVWTLETLNFDILEVRRYQSKYADDEMRPIIENRPAIESREGLYYGPMAEYTRMEALNVDSGISWVIYDENKSPEKTSSTSDLSGSDDESDDDSEASFPVIRAWNHFPVGPGTKTPVTARIDTVGYEEAPEGGWTGPWLENPGEETPLATRNLKRKRESISMDRPGTASSNSSSSINSLVSSATTPSTFFAGDSLPAISSTSSTSPPPPRERWFRQTSRHKLQQPEIMRRRRRQNLGEEEEDWGLMSVKTNPTIFLGGSGGGKIGGMGGLGTDEDGRYLVVLTRIKGLSSMALCLDFEPEW